MRETGINCVYDIAIKNVDDFISSKVIKILRKCDHKKT